MSTPEARPEGALAERGRDVLEGLPLFARPAGATSGSGRARSRAARERAVKERANAALQALAAASRGCLGGWWAGRRLFGSGAAGTPVQAELRRRVLHLHEAAHDEGLFLEDPQSAFGRLARAPSAGPYGGRVGPSHAGLPEKGEVVSLALGVASLPPGGSAPVPLVDISTTCRRYLGNLRDQMLLPAHDLDAYAASSVRAYMDPSLRSKDRAK